MSMESEITLALSEICLSLWPIIQAHKIFKTNNTDGISLMAISLLWIGTAGLLIAGYLLQSIALMFFNGLCIFVVGYIWLSKYDNLNKLESNRIQKIQKNPKNGVKNIPLESNIIHYHPLSDEFKTGD